MRLCQKPQDRIFSLGRFLRFISIKNRPFQFIPDLTDRTVNAIIRLIIIIPEYMLYCFCQISINCQIMIIHKFPVNGLSLHVLFLSLILRIADPVLCNHQF